MRGFSPVSHLLRLQARSPAIYYLGVVPQLFHLTFFCDALKIDERNDEGGNKQDAADSLLTNESGIVKSMSPLSVYVVGPTIIAQWSENISSTTIVN